MAGFFRRIFGSTESTPPFDPEREAARLLASLPPCTKKVVVASPRYSGKYRCEVIVDAARLAPFVERLCQSTLGGSQQSQVGRTAFPNWLRGAPENLGSF